MLIIKKKKKDDDIIIYYLCIYNIYIYKKVLTNPSFI